MLNGEHDTRQTHNIIGSARPESCHNVLPVKFKFQPTDEIPPSFTVVYHKSRIKVYKNFGFDKFTLSMLFANAADADNEILIGWCTFKGK